MQNLCRALPWPTNSVLEVFYEPKTLLKSMAPHIEKLVQEFNKVHRWERLLEEEQETLESVYRSLDRNYDDDCAMEGVDDGDTMRQNSFTNMPAPNMKKVI